MLLRNRELATQKYTLGLPMTIRSDTLNTVAQEVESNSSTENPILYHKDQFSSKGNLKFKKIKT